VGLIVKRRFKCEDIRVRHQKLVEYSACGDNWTKGGMVMLVYRTKNRLRIYLDCALMRLGNVLF
jgi:hypothetical protein